MDDSLLVGESVACALAGEVVVASVERIKVDAAEVLCAAVAELCRPLGATIARGHMLIESAKTACLHLFTRLCFQVLVSAVLRAVTLEGGWVMRRIWMSSRNRVRVRMMRTGLMLGIGMRIALGLRLGFHVDSIEKISRRVIVYV